MARVLRLTLNNFRNYRAATLDADSRPIVLVGPNGAGKTNLIEAISYLAPGRGLRRATPGEVAFHEGDGSWAVAAEIEGALGLAHSAPGSNATPKMKRARANTGSIAKRSRQPPHSPTICASSGWYRRWIRCSLAHRRNGAASSIASRWPSMPNMPVASTRSTARYAAATGS